MIMKNCTRTKTLACLVAALFTAASPTMAAEEGSSGGWDYGMQIYLWGAGIGGETSQGDDIDISFSDLVSNLDFGFMTTLAASKEKWTLLADIVYLDVEGDQKSTAYILERPVKTKLTIGLESWIVNAAASYAVLETGATRLETLAGARYLWMENTFKLKIGDPIKRKFSASDDFLDGVIGIRGNTGLNEKWYLTYYLDVGTGQSDFTWQAVGAVNYRFSKVDALLGYRHIEWDFDDKGALADMNSSGPYAGVKFRF